MHVLFITDEFFPSTSANSRIVFRVIDQLLKYPDIQIDILGQAPSDARWVKDYRGCWLINTPFRRFLKYQNLNKKLRYWKFLRFIIYPRTILYRIIRNKGFDNPYIWEAKNWLLKNYHKYDAVVAMSMPYYNLDIAVTVGDKVPVIIYPLEPIATFKKTENSFEQMLDYEIDLENKATKLILTNLIHKDFLSERTRVNEKKVVEAEFPCVVDRDSQIKAVNAGAHDKISIVYVGKFYPGYREPDFLCKMMDYMPDGEYELTIVGGLTVTNYKPAIVGKYLSNKHHAIRCVGFVSSEMADSYMVNADILVHVGNMQPNIMPSKILDYVSTGKPIINICKIRNCPTLPIMEAYPLGLVVYEDEGIDQEVANRIDIFCKKVIGQRIPFDTIRNLYKTYTPECVGRVFYKTIKDSIDEFKKECVE